MSLDASRWSREGILRAGALQAGSWQWTYHSGASFVVNYTVDTLPEQQLPHGRLWYSWSWRLTQQKESADYVVPLTATRPRFGGLRWWFVCPLVVRGQPCGRRARKLYLPPRARYFGCRKCHELTYTSCQESRKHNALFRHLAARTGQDLASLKRMMNSIGKRH